MRIVPIPCLSDNYAYLLVCRETKEAALVDVSEPDPVLSAIDLGAGTQDSRRDVSALLNDPREDVRIVAILSTHHHYDHVGGNEQVRSKLGIDRVYGHASDRGRIPGQTQYLQDNDTFEIGRLEVRALHIPGHTLGALAYVVSREPEDSAVFTGDTLFIGGCGRLFEGDAAMMHASLSKLAALDPRTRVFCGHEYTESNLRFAEHVEPSNIAVARAKARAARLRKDGLATVGTTIGDELSYNPFLRVSSPEIRARIGARPEASNAEVFGQLRAAKDAFKVGA